MHFLPDVYVPCEQCHGRRYNRETLEVRFKGKSIADVLEMSVEEAVEFFAHIPKIHRRLQTLHDVGLDYIRLGQPATTLSGGEAQRVKLATELSKVATGDTLYILDEPTTGLHFADVERLLEVLDRLVDAGNTVVVIEHNLDVIKTADWIIDLGPEGGDAGGEIVATGTPEEVAASTASYTGSFLRELVDAAKPQARAACAATPPRAGRGLSHRPRGNDQGPCRSARGAGGLLRHLRTCSANRGRPARGRGGAHRSALGPAARAVGREPAAALHQRRLAGRRGPGAGGPRVVVATALADRAAGRHRRPQSARHRGLQAGDLPAPGPVALDPERE